MGGGNVISGVFSSINWSNGPFFIKSETDPSGGSNYSITAVSQLLSVPYALFAGNGIRSVSTLGDSLLLGNGNYVIIPGISAANSSNNGNNGQTGITQLSCGADSVHNPAIPYGSVTDIDGNIYRTVLIGNQEWMAENLRTSRFNNGNHIGYRPGDITWILPGTCFGWLQDDSISYNCPYGKLYNWQAVVDNRNICPSGWHVSADWEWNRMIKFLDPSADTTQVGVQSSVAGGKLKSSGLAYWVAPNVQADNSSGFSALPGSGRFWDSVNGGLYDLGTGSSGIWWTKTMSNISNHPWIRVLYSSFSSTSRTNVYTNQDGYPVRCVKD